MRTKKAELTGDMDGLKTLTRRRLLFVFCMLAGCQAITASIKSSFPDDTKGNCAKTIPSALTAAEKQDVVDIHNDLRASVGDFPFETMEWDDTLAAKAQMLTDTCYITHEYLDYYCPTKNIDNTEPMGQNYMRWKMTDFNQAVDFKELIRDWWRENESYNYKTETCLAGRECRHYLQVAWQKSEKVGCGYKKCQSAYKYNPVTDKFDVLIPNQFFFVCNYYPALRYPDPFTRPYYAKPYAHGCMATVEERKCNHVEGAAYDDSKCHCTCPKSFVGKWCEFQDLSATECKDDDTCASWILPFCDDQSDLGVIARSMCAKSCGVC